MVVNTKMKNIVLALLVSFLTILVSFLTNSFLFSPNDATGIFFGLVWGCVNFYLIRQLLSTYFIRTEKKYLKFLLISLIKFPLLYFAGYQLLQIQYFSPWNLLIGFSISLIVFAQKSYVEMTKT